MYLPPQFEITDRAWVVGLIERHPFGLLITPGEEYPRVSHVPILYRERGDGLTLVGHVARGNPHAESIRAGSRATLVFQGPHAYVSASWYEEPYATVPTWNYEAVHVNGELRQSDAWSAVKLLSAAMEGTTAQSWDPERLDVRYRENQLRGIVAFELRADAVYAKAKLSQNRTQIDRLRVISKLSASADQTERECAEAMSREMPE
jgi:transcriptional regulator